MSLRDHGFSVSPLTYRDGDGAPPPAADGLALLLHAPEHDRGHPSRQLVGTLRKAGWRVIMVAAEDDPVAADAAAEAVAAGAAGVVDTAHSFNALLGSLSRALAGRPAISDLERQRWLARHRASRERRRRLTGRFDQLSPREREILLGLYHGQHAAAIAERFGSSLSTVRSQIKSMLTKLDVHSQLEAVALLHDHPLGLVERLVHESSDPAAEGA